MLPSNESVNSFQYRQTYTELEIEEGSLSVDPPTDYEGETYLIARGCDGLEYWFVAAEGGWVVDHTWASVMLIRRWLKPSARKGNQLKLV